MPKSYALMILAGTALAAAGVALAQPAAAPPAAEAQPAPAPTSIFSFARPSYLAGKLPNMIDILPPAPVKGTARYDADRAIFRTTRSLKDTPRWFLAVNDVEQAPASLLRDFSCAVGVELTTDNTKAFMRVIAHAAPDVSASVNTPKDFFRRKRPYLLDDGDICVAKTASLAQSPDYPSGHTTWGWTFGSILAQVAPDRTTAILARARAYGESRVVCGVHNASAVEAGRVTASALMTALNASPDFRREMEAARAEMTALRASGAPKPDAGRCRSEAALIAKTPW